MGDWLANDGAKDVVEGRAVRSPALVFRPNLGWHDVELHPVVAPPPLLVHRAGLEVRKLVVENTAP